MATGRATLASHQSVQCTVQASKTFKDHNKKAWKWAQILFQWHDLLSCTVLLGLPKRVVQPIGHGLSCAANDKGLGLHKAQMIIYLGYTLDTLD